MYNVKYHSDRITEDMLIDIIFKACRSNEKRKAVQADGYTITFDESYTPPGEYLALVHDSDSYLCGSAIIDEMDC